MEYVTLFAGKTSRFDQLLPERVYTDSEEGEAFVWI